MYSRAGLAAGVVAGIGSTLHNWMTLRPYTFHARPDAASFELRGPVRSVETMSGEPASLSRAGWVEDSRHFHRIIFDLHGRSTLEEFARGNRPLAIGGRIRRGLGLQSVPVDFVADDFSFQLTDRLEREYVNDQISVERVWHRIIDSGRVKAVHEAERRFLYEDGRLAGIRETRDGRERELVYHYDNGGRVTDIVPGSFVIDQHLAFEYVDGRCVRKTRKARNGSSFGTIDYRYEGNQVVGEIERADISEPPGSYVERVYNESGLLSATVRRDYNDAARRKQLWEYALDSRGNWLVQRMLESSPQASAHGNISQMYSYESTRQIAYA